MTEASATNGLSPQVIEPYGRYDAVFDFYIRASGTGVASEIWIHDWSTVTDPEILTDPGPAIRFYNGTLQARTGTSTEGVYEWKCGTCNGLSTLGVCDDFTAATCPTATSNTWYRIKITYEAQTALFTAEYAPANASCDHTESLTPFATNFESRYNNDLGDNGFQRWQVRSNAIGVTIEAANMEWTAQSTAFSNCNPLSTDGEACKSSLQCSLEGLGIAYQACPDITPYCGGQAALPVNSTDAVAVAGYYTPPDDYGTAYAHSQATGFVVGPNSILESAHGLLVGGSGSGPEAELDPVNWYFGERKILGDPYSFNGLKHPDYVLDANGQTIYPYRGASPVLGTTTEATSDIVISYTLDTLPIASYAGTIYDSATESATCDKIIAQGHTGADPNNREREIYVLTTRDSDPLGRGWLEATGHTPRTSILSGGDSGGPVMAIGDWDGTGQYPKLVGVMGGGRGWLSFDRATAPSLSAFFSAYKDTPPDLVAKEDVTIHDMFITRAPGDPDLTDEVDGIDLTMGAKVTSTSNPFNLLFVWRNTDSNRTLSCLARREDENGWYSCDVHFPYRSGNRWFLENVLVSKPNGVTSLDGRVDIALRGVYGAHWPFGSTVGQAQFDNKPPTTSVHVSPARIGAPGGDIRCAYTATDNANTADNNVASGILRSGCVYDLGGEPLTCVGPTSDSLVFPASADFCTTTIPTAINPGTTVTQSHFFAQDLQHQSSRTATSSSFTLFDCQEPTADVQSADGADPGDQAMTPVGGYEPEFDFFVRPSSSAANGMVLIGNQAIASEADAEFGIRFNPADPGATVDVLDNGVWTDTGYGYVPGTWYQVFIHGQNTTRPQTTTSGTYSVSIAPCGSSLTEIASGVVTGDGTRNLEAMNTWTVLSEAGQTIGVSDMVWGVPRCIATQCAPLGFAFEPWDCGTNIPNGCGGTIAYCGAVGGNLDCGDGAGGLECINYVCQ